ncbi:branched-chain amino acid ABC transporter permease, partial [Listeria monocytogenes]|nr:branched-chain amino acid ABC transporter permease [Listeria monocytogenes]
MTRRTIINDIGSEYMEMMIQQLINGLFLGSIYAL